MEISVTTTSKANTASNTIYFSNFHGLIHVLKDPSKYGEEVQITNIN